MKTDDIMLILGLFGVIISITVLYAFPPDALVEALKQSR